MNFLFVNTQELTALMELPMIQRVVYLMGIRPYMDKQTCIVGIKRKISYQSLREILYVAPIPGVKTEYPSHQQVRRAIKSLERVGIVAIQSTEKNLILKCLLAEENTFVQNQAGMRPTPRSDISQISYIDVKTTTYKDFSEQADIRKTTQADIPLNSNNNNYIFLLKHFELFWSLYPLKNSEQKAWQAFQELNPSEDLIAQIISALQSQIAYIQRQQALGRWVPNWKNPANWLVQRCWSDEIPTEQLTQENHHAKNRRSSRKEQVTDALWALCKPDSEEQENASNVIEFSKWRY